MRPVYRNLVFTVPVIIMFVVSLLVILSRSAGDAPIGTLAGLGVLMLGGLAGWWLSWRVFKIV